MTTTPTVWKPTFFPNIENPAGNQRGVQSIGLANGNILTVWEDDTQGTSPGHDIMGRIMTPEGQITGSPFQINSAIIGGDEDEPKIALMPDGGWVVAYGSYDGFQYMIVVERFNSAGSQQSSRFITDADHNMAQWEITVDSAGNYTVVFERVTDETVHTGDPVLSINVHAITYDHATNNASPEHTGLAQNSRDDDDSLAAIASFSNGHIITLTTEPDYSNLGDPSGTVEFAITDPATGARTHLPTQIAGSPGFLSFQDDDALDVAVLTGGQFVMLYTELSSSGHDHIWGLNMRIGAGETSNVVGPAITVVPSAPHPVVDNGQVVALPDGGFFVAWQVFSSIFGPVPLEGQRFDASGNTVGAKVSIGSGRELSGLSLTDDGRILVSFVAGAGADFEVAEVIVDPRESTIAGTSLGEALTSQSFSSIVQGLGGDDTIYGQAGDDFIYGGAGDDDLRGGSGADTLFGEAGADALQGGPGDDTYVLGDLHRLDPNLNLFVYDTVIEAANGGVDTVEVAHVFNNQVTAYTLPANVENGLVVQDDAFALFGNALANRLTGNAANNFLSGGAGDDILDGAVGADTGSFSQYRSVYDVRSYVQGGQLKTDVIHTGGDGSDVLANIELLAFTDGTFHNDGANLNHISNALGNRFDDVLFQSASTGQVVVAGMWGGAFNGWNIGTGALGTAWKAIAVGDVNPAHTGGAETFVQNTTNGTILYYSLDTGAATSGVVSASLTADWKLRAVGDINANGGVDAVVQQASSGTIYYANMTGGAFQGWGLVNANLTGDWVAVGAADINHDGTADVIVQQQSTGTIYFANMINGAFGGWGVVSAKLTPDWKARAAGDVNGDGFADVVVQQASTGTAYYANMAGGAFSGWGVVAQNTGPAWVAEGLADVDNDGYRDVLMQNTGDGTTYYAHMGASGFTNWGVVAANISTDWHVV